MIEYDILLKIGITYLLAIMSPGPSIIAIFRNGSIYGQKVGICTALGTIIGIALQAFYILLGINFTYSLYIMEILQIICAAYLMYLGITGLIRTIHNTDKITIGEAKNSNQTMTTKEGFKQGFLIDALNPLALSFFLTIFSTFIAKDATTLFKVVCWLEIVIIGAIWFIGASIFISSNTIQSILTGRTAKYINIITLVLFVFFGWNLLFKAVLN
ncbi:MAG: LysE family translocator [Rickettsiales bacterium]|jgi:threonine/homoserine/homoserine lactone efflux protein|nr:LysE family translocator [Rickettsiales bacterium]